MDSHRSGEDAISMDDSDFHNNQQQMNHRHHILHRFNDNHHQDDDFSSNRTDGIAVGGGTSDDYQTASNNPRGTVQGSQVQPRILQSQEISNGGTNFRDVPRSIGGGLQQQYRNHREEDDDVPSLHDQQFKQMPLPSQYSNLVQSMRPAESGRYASNGFRVSRQVDMGQRGSKTTQFNSHHGEQCFQSVDIQNACTACTAHIKALSYSSLYSANSMVYSQNVPVVFNTKTVQDDKAMTGATGGRHISKYLRFEIEVLRQHFNRGANHATNLHPHQSKTGGSNGDLLYFTMSDDSNPMFLYIAQIDLSKFLKIRKEQNIFVEFSQLAEKAQALFDLCISNKEENSDLNRFICVINQVEGASSDDQHLAIVDIFEHNEFRNLLHLRLEFKRSSAEETAQWLSKKLLMQRKVNVDLQQECSEYSEQHEQDRLRINQIKQSLLALKQTQNEELQRIKDDHEAQLENAGEAKIRVINELKVTYETQIQELTTEFEERLQEIKTDADSLRHELTRTQESSKQLGESIQDKEEKIDELNGEMRDLQHEKERLLRIIDDLKEVKNVLERRLLEQTMLKESVEKELERSDHTIQSLKSENQILEETNQGQGMISDQIKEKLLMANEQRKYKDSELIRVQEKVTNLNLKIASLKEKKVQSKKAYKAQREEKSQIEGHNVQLQGQISELKGTTEKLQRDIESRQKLLDTYEGKLKEDQQTLLSNKNLIEYLNKTLNDAQKYTFHTMIKTTGDSLRTQTEGIPKVNNTRFSSTISPMRAAAAGTAGIPPTTLSYTGGISQQHTQSTRQLNKIPIPYQGQKLDIGGGQKQDDIAQMMNYKPCNNQLSLPLTEFYLSKGSSNGPSNYLSFGGVHKPQPKEDLISSTSKANFNHVMSNPFSYQLERERLISEEKLKQRNDQSYQSKQYQMIGSQQQPNTNPYQQKSLSQLFTASAHRQQQQQYPEQLPYQNQARVTAAVSGGGYQQFLGQWSETGENDIMANDQMEVRREEVDAAIMLQRPDMDDDDDDDQLVE